MLQVLPPDAPPPLAALLAGCQRQERTAQRRLYGQFHGFALGVCLRYARDREQALEAVNDGFMKVFRDIGRFDAGRHADLAGSFRGWLKRLMIHTAIDQFRAEQRHQHQQELDDAVALTQADASPTALDALSYEELLTLVQRLPPAYRAVFNLAVIDGYGHEEIAARLGISVGTSKSNLFKARAHLRTMVLEQLPKSNYTNYVAG